MKTTTSLTIAASTFAAIALSSCGTSDPEYKEWKRQQEEQAAAANNPYGAPAASNPFGTPQPGGDPSITRAAAGDAPYQPLPGVPQPPAYPPAPAEGGAIPGGAPAAGGTSHTVAAGESLWGLARKYGTSIEAIQSANGLTGTTIRTGQTLTIPGQ